MSNDMTCEKLRGIGAELALGILPGRERAAAVAHLDRCADCREYVEQLTLVGDGLIGLLPGCEPPVGFETRVAQALTQGTPAQDGRARGRGGGGGGRGGGGRRGGGGGAGGGARGGRARARVAGAWRRGFGGRLRLRLVSAVAALVLAVGFGGWVAGTAIENVVAGAPRSAGGAADLLHGDLTSVAAPRQSAGEVYAHTGSPGWIYMTVDLTGTHASYSGMVSCLLERRDGGTVRTGTFTLHQGRGFWGGPTPVDPASVSGARLTSPDGTVLATTHLTSGGET
ncbi:anti-sigma factor family protein [Streptomyces mirabilis]|uniref:anti-sigma factor family protein n=1 Tax=Streptomyces mirabilis TaxID=68239 RepID=UPI003693A7E2